LRVMRSISVTRNAFGQPAATSTVFSDKNVYVG
jgi:hypothetical protein